MDLLRRIHDTIARLQWADLLELLVIGLVVWAVMRFLKGTRGARLLRGFLLLLVGSTLILNLVANALDLERIKAIYPIFVGSLLLSALVAFQPELRRALIRLGTATFFADTARDVDRLIEQIVEAAATLSKSKIGAIVAFERGIEFGALLDTGCRLDAEVSKELLVTIFWPGSPLHDMGVVISSGRIAAAAVQFPLTESEDLDPSLGSRHRAAVGLSQEFDTVVMVVSEETGIISLVESGVMHRFLTPETLRDELRTRLGRAKHEMETEQSTASV